MKTKRFRLPPREALSQDLDIEGEGLSESSRVFDIDPLQSETITTKPNTNLGKPNSGKKSWIIQNRYLDRISQVMSFTIQSRSADVHKKPFSESEIIKRMTRGEEIQIIRKKNGWLQLKSGGYISEDDILLEPDKK